MHKGHSQGKAPRKALPKSKKETGKGQRGGIPRPCEVLKGVSIQLSLPLIKSIYTNTEMDDT